MQNGHSILGASKELEQALPKFWSLVSLFPRNTQQKVASKDEENYTRENRKGKPGSTIS